MVVVDFSDSEDKLQILACMPPLIPMVSPEM